MENPAIGSYHYERYCPNCRRTTVFFVTISVSKNVVIPERAKEFIVMTTTCQVCKIGEGKAI